MQEWFDVVHEKNVLMSYESELAIQWVLFAFQNSHLPTFETPFWLVEMSYKTKRRHWLKLHSSYGYLDRQSSHCRNLLTSEKFMVHASDFHWMRQLLLRTIRFEALLQFAVDYVPLPANDNRL